MLKEIHIRDFAIVHHLNLELGEGMNVLTGETGAGKSILLGALGLCLGDRAAADSIRSGADRAEVSAVFEPSGDTGIHDWLAEHELDDGGDAVIVRRVIQEGGRSRGFINGTPVSLQLLRKLGEQLVDIHGQHAHQSLLRTAMQRQLIDAYARADEPLAAVRAAHARWREIEEALERLEGTGANYEERLDLLRYQVGELEGASLSAEEIANLEAEHRRLAHAGDLIATAHSLLAALYDDDQSAQTTLGRAIRELEERRGFDPALAEADDLFQSALTHLNEGCDALRRFADSLDADPERLAELERRIATLKDLARKHRVGMEELPETLERLRAELEDLEGAEHRLQELREARQEAADDYRRTAETLSEIRRDAAGRLADEVAALLADLGMAKAELLPRVEFDTDARPTAHGSDRIELHVRTNPGQPPGPLSKIASGGELSRLGLAVQVATISRAGAIPTLIFDEADAGIGGAVAEVVGRMLSTLGGRHQVLCVTHLPQVAAQAEHHFHVAKASEGEETRTTVIPLAQEERVEEVARMLGGVEITDHERAAAREMLTRGGKA